MGVERHPRVGEPPLSLAPQIIKHPGQMTSVGLPDLQDIVRTEHRDQPGPESDRHDRTLALGHGQEMASRDCIPYLHEAADLVDRRFASRQSQEAEAMHHPLMDLAKFLRVEGLECFSG